MNVQRKLWAECAGFCQNPNCNDYLFAEIAEDLVSLANMAHIIGVGSHGPRSEHELAELIEKDGTDNLLMLCLKCHKIIDELENRYPVETLREWKTRHIKDISSIFKLPTFRSERELLIEIDQLLEQNSAIFDQYGPYSTLALSNPQGDTQWIWRERCLNTILPNNDRIVRIIEKHKNSFGYPWDVYKAMLAFEVHVDSFKENCLFDKRINDYRQFPRSFPDFVKRKLGMVINSTGEDRESEEIEYRYNTVAKYVDDFLSQHSRIALMEKSVGVFL